MPRKTANPMGVGHWEDFTTEKAAIQYARLMEGQGKEVLRQGKFVRVSEKSWGKQNPAKSGAQYRLAQAVLSGSSDAMPVEVAREIVEKTPAKMRSQYSKRNPESSAADMYKSFHGAPSEQLVTYHDEEHYHEYLAELGVCCGVLVEVADGSIQAIGLSGYNWEGKGKDAGFVEGVGESKENGRRRRNSKGPFTQASDLVFGGAKQLDSKLGKVLSGNPSVGDDVRQAAFVAGKYWRTVEHESGVANARVVSYGFAKWWNSLSPKAASSQGQTKSALEKDFREGYAAQKRIESGKDTRRNPADAIDPITTLLCSNEDGTQLYLQGGDQSLDLDALGITDHAATKELITVGEAVQIWYSTHKDFDDHEEISYHHELGEETGNRPVLAFDRMNERLLLIGGEYRIEQPIFETSPGIEN